MRSLRWEPIVAIAVLATAAMAALGAVRDTAVPSLVLPALVLSAASLAFAADDLDALVLPAVPVSPGRRLARRVARGLPLAAAGWAAAGVVAVRSGAQVPPGVAGLSIGVVALAVGVALDRWTAVESPGAVAAVGTVLVLAVFALAFPSASLPSAGSPSTTAGLATAAGIATILVVQRGRP